MTNMQIAITIAILAVGTYLTRAVPFLFFPAHKDPPPWVRFLGQSLPYAIVGMLVIYCLKDVSLAAAPHGLPELLAIAAIVVVHVYKNNLLLSIGGGTLFYMFLIQVVFSA